MIFVCGIKANILFLLIYQLPINMMQLNTGYKRERDAVIDKL